MTPDKEISQEAARAMLAALRSVRAAMDGVSADGAGDLSDADAARLWNAAAEQADAAIALAERGA